MNYVTVKVSDLQPEKVEEIRVHLGEYWHEGMLDNVIFEVGNEPNKKWWWEEDETTIESILAGVVDEVPIHPDHKDIMDVMADLFDGTETEQ